jgi:hypothetical protein
MPAQWRPKVQFQTTVYKTVAAPILFPTAPQRLHRPSWRKVNGSLDRCAE